MQFYPNNISVNELGFAVSASIARTGSLIQTFTAIPVTASLALNITGSTGAAGTSAGPISGPKGAQGSRGVTGPRGNSVYLISSSWHDATKGGASCASAPANCYEYTFYSSYVVGGTRYCDFGSPNITVYSTDAGLSAGSSPMFFNSICTNPALGQNLGAYTPDSTAYSTDGSGTLQTLGVCNESL